MERWVFERDIQIQYLRLKLEHENLWFRKRWTGCNVGDTRSNLGTGERVTMLGSSHAF